jgi:hypothetical protein
MNNICPKCGADKETTGYVKGKNYCKVCSNLYSKMYKSRNKEKISEYNKEYKKNHAEEISMYNKKYNVDNRVAIQKRHTPYLAKKRKTDPQYALSVCLRNRMNKLLKNIESENTLILLGCSLEFYKKWLEFQFKADMTFENHGKIWHIDHVIPCKRFDLLDENERHKCFNWANMQPLYAKHNMSKKDRITEEEIISHRKIIKSFIKIIKKEKYTIYDYDAQKYVNL